MVQAGDFAFFEAGRADVVAGVAAVGTGFELGADDVGNAEKVADGGDDELVGRGDDEGFVAGHLVALHQHTLHGRDVGRDELCHKFAVKFRQLFFAVTGKRSKVEFEEGVDVEAAVLVVAVEFFVLRFGFGSVNQPFFDEVLRPRVVGIGVDEGVVEVEDGEVFHWVSCCFKSWRRSGRVMRLPMVTA